MSRPPSKRSKSKRRPLSKEQLQKRAQERERLNFEKRIRSLFEKIGFLRIPVDGEHFEFDGRTGEIDDIFVHENVVILTEYYTGRPDNSHILKKLPLYQKINHSPNLFVKFAKERFFGFAESLNKIYGDKNINIRILYASKNNPDDEIYDLCKGAVSIFSGMNQKYFLSLVGTISKSAIFEILKFLNLEYSDIGEVALKTSRDSFSYEGFLLPDGQSSYPPGYKIVSFYADPERLIGKSYVLRRDGWRENFQLYQRILLADKIRNMRTYLSNEGRVFVNNIVATLPAGTRINEAGSPGQNLVSDTNKVIPVSVQIPDTFDAIGIVDGQHRLYCYHEGNDKAEEIIKILRKKQTLLVTGIIYPENTSIADRLQFEAKLFLEINGTQARVQPALTQEIELIVRPQSTVSIAKRIIKELSVSGPYKGLLQTSYFDPPEKIKTVSIVSYGLKPLVKTEGNDSLYAIWENKSPLENNKIPNNTAIEEYVKFCVTLINNYMLAAKMAHGLEGWKLNDEIRSPLTRPTVINGLIVCLRKIIEAKITMDSDFHREKLTKLHEIDFSSYKSSHWQSLGKEIFKVCYS